MPKNKRHSDEEVNPHSTKRSKFTSVGWVNHPPVYSTTDKAKMCTLIDQLKESINTWHGDEKDGYFQQKVEDALIILNDTIDLDAEDTKKLYYYQLNGKAEAIIVFSCYNGNEIYISALVAHPISANAGTILVEHALNKVPLGERRDSSIELSSMKEAINFYKAIGFKHQPMKDDSGPYDYMTLTPSLSDRWYYDNNNKWGLNKYQTSKFITSAPSM